MARRIAAIIRHGDYHQMPGVPSAHQPFPINADGESHAREAAAVIDDVMSHNDWELSRIVDCSRMLRAWQTAEIIIESLAGTKKPELRLESFDELAERGVGCAANLTVEQIAEIIHDDPRYPDLPQDWKSNSEYRLPLQGAESLLEAGERVAAHLVRRMPSSPVEQDTLKIFVGHGAAFRHAAFHLGVLEYEQIARLSMFHGQPVFLEMLEDDNWRHIEGEWKVRETNSDFTD